MNFLININKIFIGFSQKYTQYSAFALVYDARYGLSHFALSRFRHRLEFARYTLSDEQ